jgi:pilus assembly protein Flp/PilA
MLIAAVDYAQFCESHGSTSMFGNIKNLLKDESGATAIEYGLIAALVSVAAITALTAMGSSLQDMFGRVSNELTTAVNQSGT